MSKETLEVSMSGLARLTSAASDFASFEKVRIADAVIADLQSRPAIGIFDEIEARHMWDEYCWSLQEGPFDNNEFVGTMSVGTVSGNWKQTVESLVSGEVHKLPEYALVFLSAQAFKEDGNSDDAESVGNIWPGGVTDTIMAVIRNRALLRNLDLIGPHGGDLIGYSVEGSGIVWGALSECGEAIELVASHRSRLIAPDADLSGLALEMVNAFIAIAKAETDSSDFSQFLEKFEDQVRDLLIKNDVIPTLEAIRSRMLEQLDG